MACIYKRKGTAFWWLKWRNPATGKEEYKSTGLRVGDGADYAKALMVRNQHAVLETTPGSATLTKQNPFAGWVEPYLKASHSNSLRTLQRYLANWEMIAAYLASRDIVAPAQVNREVCLGYIDWRKKLPHRNGKKPVCMNTIIWEIKAFVKILNEAVTRGYMPFNPGVRLKLKKEPPRPKEEMSDDQMAIVSAAIQKRIQKATSEHDKQIADFLFVSWEIARLQGIRLNETYIAMEDVDLNRRVMMVMGKGKKLEEVNLNPGLIPLLQRLKDEGRTHTYVKPRMASLNWFKVFRGIRKRHQGFKNVSFHSTRVTVVSRMERAGAPEAVVMKTVLHASQTIHRIYRKVKAEELAPYWAAVNASKPSTGGNNQAGGGS